MFIDIQWEGVNLSDFFLKANFLKITLVKENSRKNAIFKNLGGIQKTEGKGHQLKPLYEKKWI